MISIFSVPENIKVTLELGETTLKLFNRALDLYARNKEIGDLMGELDGSSNSLKKKIDENPDPNPTD